MSEGPPLTLQSVYERAISLPPAERARFLELAQAHVPDLYPELIRLVEAYDKAQQNMVGPYRMVRELGRGGMGAVYLAIRSDDTFQKTVALKVISSEIANEEFIRRFKQERQILAALDHPHITRILDGGSTATGQPYYVMDYVDGMPLEEFCDKHRFSVAARLNLVLQLCDAVQYLHDNAVIHRDLKPGNVLVDKDGRAKLLDFGIAKIVTPMARADGPTMIMTPGYASPEQLAGQPASRASDQYSLGVILYRLLTGRSPFDSADGTHNMKAQVSGATPPPPSTNLVNTAQRSEQTEREFKRRVEGDLDRIVLKALHPDPARRYESVGALAHDIRNYLAGQPVTARPDSLTYRTSRFVGRNKLVVALVALLLVVTAAGTGLGVWLYIEKVKVEAKQSEVDRMSEMLSARLANWPLAPEQGGPSVAERVADVQRANTLLRQDAPAILTSRRADLARLGRMVDRVVAYLDRAAGLSLTQPPVLKEISTGYEQAANLNVVATGRSEWATKQKAERNYLKAAAVVAHAPGMEPEYVRQRLAQLDQRMAAIGSHLQPGGEPATTEPATDRPPETATKAEPPVVERPAVTESQRTEPKRETVQEGPTVSREELEELLQRLETAAAQATRARQNLEALRQRLGAQGQRVNADIESGMAQVEAYLQDARSAAGRSDLKSAREALAQCEYTLRKVLRAVGN